MTWKKGKSGNPKGRPTILLPEVQGLVDKSKNDIKLLLINLLGMTNEDFERRSVARKISKTEMLFIKCIERIENDGNMDAYRKLLEILVGKLPEEPAEFELSSEEKMIVLEFRKRLGKLNEPTPIQDSSGLC